MLKALTLVVSTVLAVAALTVFSAAQAQDGSIEMNLAEKAVRLTFGVGDLSPANWTGRFSPSAVGELRGGWTIRTQRRQGKNVEPDDVETASITGQLAVSGSESVEVRTEQGNFSFAFDSLPMAAPRAFLEGRVLAEQLPASARLTTGATDDDFPAIAAGVDGTIWCAYVEHDRGTAVDAEATARGEFSSLRPANAGDRVRLMKFKGSAWSQVNALTDSGLDVWRPTIAVDASGVVWSTWSQNDDGNWNLYARSYDSKAGMSGEIRQLTSQAGSEINAGAATDSSGRVWLTWQGWNDGQFDIWIAPLDDMKPMRVSPSDANDWNPVIAAGPDGEVWVAWDTYDKGDYDVYARSYRSGKAAEPIAIASSPRFEARASIAVDKQGRAWVAYEDGGEQWGKDYGDRFPGRKGVPFYQDRYVRVRAVANGRLLQTASQFRPRAIDYFSDDPQRPTQKRRRASMPRISVDDAGRVWMLYRRHPRQDGRGEHWVSFVTHYSGGEWSKAIQLASTDNLVDNRPSIVSHEGGLMVVHSTDKRTNSVQDAMDNDIHASWLQIAGEADPVALVKPDPDPRPMLPIHPNEEADIERMRAKRVSVGGKQLRYLRGEFHRHTEISAHRDWDGPLEEVWRYGLDVADMDWIGPGDHDYGRGQDYLWWLTQKQTDLYLHPGTFLPMHTYERSNSYPSGHRNVIFPERGIKALPRLPGRNRLFGTYEGGSDDIRNLYSYLREFGGICSSHTSGTNMGTDWRDADPELEPVVEIFQGHRQSYEETNAPRAARGEHDTIQGYRPLGFLWEAFKRGRRLGFQASSDHVSTHISYAIVITDDASRQGIVDAFKKRHSYAANDNIILDVRSGDHIMGDEFSTSERPRLEIEVVGTSPIRTLDIVRQVNTEAPTYAASFELGADEASFSWTDTSAVPGSTYMYYVRVLQENEALAWGSPMWLDFTE